MSLRTSVGIAIASGFAGLVAMVLWWLEVVTWSGAPWLGIVLLLGSVAALNAASLVMLRSMSHNMAMVRDRSKRAVDTAQRTAQRVDEIRTQLLFGPIAHLPGQLGRLEGGREGDEPARQPAKPRPGNSMPHPTTEFDAVYVINLDRDIDRMQHTAAMLDKHEIPFERFTAIDGSTPEHTEAWKRYQAQGPQLALEQHTGQRLIESPGAWGYLKTMDALLSDASGRGLARILVLDDDVMVHREFHEQFGEAWADLPDDWKLVYLGSASADPSKTAPYSNHLYHPGAMANGSYAIAIDRSVFDQALASIRRYDWPFDAGALREIDASYPDRVFVVHPPLVLANVAESGIRPGRPLDAHAEKHGWNLDDYEQPLAQE